MKRYYTTTKSGEEVEVSPEDAKQLVALGKKKPEDFNISEEPDAPVDDKVYEQYKTLPVAKEQMQGGFQYQRDASKSGKDIYKELADKVLEGGYSNLSLEDKDLFNQQAKYSQAAKSRSLAEIQDLANKQAEQRKIDNRSLPAKAYQGVRDVLAENVGGPLASWFGRGNEADVVNGKKVGNDETYLESVARRLPLEIEAGKKDEGLSGILSDPTNILPYAGTALGAGAKIGKAALGAGKFIGLGEQIGAGAKYIDKGVELAKDIPYVTDAITAGSNLKPVAKTIEWLKDSPIAAATLKAGAIDAAVGGASSYDPLNEGSFVKRAAGQGLAGALLGGFGAHQKEEALGKNFIGEDRLDKAVMKDKKGTDLERLTRDEKEKVYQELPWIARRKDYYDVGKDFTNTSSKAYKFANDVSDKAFDESHGMVGAILVSDLEKAMKAGIEQGSNFSKNYTDDLIKDYLHNPETGKLTSIKYTARLKPAEFSEDAKKILTEAAKDAKQKIELEKLLTGERIKISDLGPILGSLNTDIKGLIEKAPTAKANMAMDAKSGIKDFILSKKNNENYRMGSIPFNNEYKSYNEILEEIQPGAEAKYRLGKKLLNTVARTNETGQAMRLGSDGIAAYVKPPTNYILPNLQYKLGDKLSRSLWRSATETEIRKKLIDDKKKK